MHSSNMKSYALQMEHSPSWIRQYNRDVELRMFRLMASIKEDIQSTTLVKVEAAPCELHTFLVWASDIKSAWCDVLPLGFNAKLQQFEGMYLYLQKQA